jgi:very-short-patch-repair endonuclease
VSEFGSRIDVSVPGYPGSGRPGIALHRVCAFDADDRAVRNGIPVTSVARTLLDLAEVLPPRRLKYAFEQAERLELLDLWALHALRDRSPGRHGLKAIADLISEADEPPDVRSKLERRFVDFCRERNLPLPAFNVSLEGATVDALWKAQRVIVELDSYSFHRSRTAFESDRARDADMQLAGYRVLRVTFRRLEREPAAVADQLRSLLRAAISPPRIA